jgi:hypothetical protein
MSPTSIAKTLVSMTVAGLVSVALLSPANASSLQREARATADHASSRNPSIASTSQLPWLAPVGYRQPRPSALPQDDGFSGWDR